MEGWPASCPSHRQPALGPRLLSLALDSQARQLPSLFARRRWTNSHWRKPRRQADPTRKSSPLCAGRPVVDGPPCHAARCRALRGYARSVAGAAGALACHSCSCPSEGPQKKEKGK